MIQRKGEIRTMGRKKVRYWIIRYIGLLLLPPFLAIAILFSYMVSNMADRSVELSRKTMQLYVSQLEESMNSMERILLTVYDNNMDLSYLCVSEDVNQLYMSKTAYSRYLAREMLVFGRFSGMFTLVERENERIYIDAGDGSCDVIREDILSLTKEEDLPASISTKEWFVRKTGDQYYLMRIVKNSRNYCGAWISLESLAEYMKESCDVAAAEAAITDAQGEIVSGSVKNAERLVRNYSEGSIYVSDGRHRDYTAGRVDMFDGLMHFFLFVPAGVILREVNILKKVLLGVLALVAVLLVIFWRKIREKIIVPCVNLSAAMERFEAETPSLQQENMLWEFEQMQKGFMDMKEQIYTLKIQRYEQQLREQRIHMEYLFGQMQPHFFLNTLNVLYSFAEIERYDLIQSLVLAMVKYLRYIFNNGSKPVALREEISHVEDFITIQQIRYPDRIFFRKEIERGMEDIAILPFLLQTFVENSIKYGLNEEQRNEIYIGVSMCGEKVQIRIADTGKGFSKEQIREINERPAEQEGIYKVGIRNTRQRLQLMYGEDAGIEVGNRPEGGAVVTISFPAGSGLEEKADESAYSG